MIQTVQTLPHHLTKIDTLQDQVNHLNHVLDSLNTVSAATSIGTSYFHDIIGGVIMITIMILTLIVTIAGFVNWTVLMKRFYTMTDSVRQEMNVRMATNEEAFTELTQTFQKEIERINEETTRVNIDSARAMFHTTNVRGDTAIAAMWAIVIVDGFNKVGEEELLKTWMEVAKVQTERITSKDIEIYYKDLIAKINEVKSNFNGEYLAMFLEFEETCNKKFYSLKPLEEN